MSVLIWVQNFMVFLKEFFKNVNFEKDQQTKKIQSIQNFVQALRFYLNQYKSMYTAQMSLAEKLPLKLLNQC